MSMSCPAPPLPKFTFTSPADTSREPSSVDVESSAVPLSVRRPVIIEKATDTDSSAQPQKPAGVLSAPQRLSRRQLSDNTLRPSSANFLQSNHGLSPEDQKMDSASLRRHSGQSRVPFMPLSSAEKREQQRLPLRAFKKIGRVGTLPALVNSSNPANIQLALHGSTPPQLGAGGGGSGDEVPALSGSAMSSGSRATAAGMGSAFQRWNHRRGSHLGWDSARPQSAARQQQQMLEKIYTKGELKEYQQLFKMFDTDGSGAIGSEELKGAMQSIGMEADDAEIERLIKEVDEDGNGEIDFPEFCQCMKTAERQGGFRQKPTNDEVVRQCFEVFDQDGNGLITENEFIYVAKEVGGFSHELAEFVFRELLGDSASDHLDLDRFSAIVEDYLSEHNQGDFDAEEEGPDGGGGSNK